MQKYLLPAAAVSAFVAGMAIVPNTFAAPADCNAVKSSEFTDALTTCDGNIKLGESITLTGVASINSTITIDLNGFDITREGTTSNHTGLSVKTGGNLTLQNTGVGGGKINLSPNGVALSVNASDAVATVGSGVTLESGGEGYAAKVMNGGKLYATGNAAFVSTGETAIINDSSTVEIKDQATVTASNGTAIQAQGTDAVVNISGGTISGKDKALTGTQGATNTKFTITGGDLVSSEGVGIIILGENPSLTMSGGSVHAQSFALSGNGSQTTNSNIEISGSASLTSDETAAIYNPQSGSLKVTGGTLSGAFGIVARQGKVSVTGGTIKAEGSGNQTVGDAGAELPAGTAILVDNTEDYGHGTPGTVTLSGPVVINATAENPVLAYGVDNNEGDTLMVEAGVDFIGTRPSADYLAAGLAVGPNGVVMTEAEAEAMEAELNRPTPTPTENPENPNTADPIALYATVAVLAVLGLGATAVLAKKSNR